MTDAGVPREGPVARGAAGPSRVRGAVLASLCLAVSLVVACGEGEPRLDEELRGIVELPRGARLHTVEVGGSGGEDVLDPRRLEVRPGDGVQFVVVDGRPHALRFDGERLASGPGAFLRETGQMASPPLVDAGVRFVVTFPDAPPGTYPYLCLSHPETGRGVVVVRQEE